MMKRKYPVFLISALTLCSTCFCGDWPQWRGVNRDGLSNEQGLLKEWPDEGPELEWVFDDAGIGYSGFSIVADKLFTMGARKNVTQVICVNLKDGSEIWSANVGDVLENGWGDGPRSTPTVDGEHVYALGGKGDLVCLNTTQGKEVWRVKLSDFGGKVPNWGYSESVLVDGEHVVCTPGGADGAILALNKKTGDEIWQSADFTDGAQYSSIIKAKHNDKTQYIQMTKESVAGIDATNGGVLWKTEWPGRVAVVPTPIFQEGSVYVTAGYGVGSNLFKLGANNEVEPVYDSKSKRVMKNHHGGVVLIDDHIYGYSDGLGWVCQNMKTGELIWKERSALGKGAIGYADGMLYLVSENGGEVVLISASPKGWSEKGRFVLDQQSKQRKPKGKIWTHPVIANGRLFLRDQELVHAYKVKKE